MNQLSPYQSPTTTGRSSALPSLLTTQTKWPFAPCCTARCGTRIAFGRIAPMQPRAHVLVRTQHALRIVDRRADQERSGLRVVRRVGERDPALVREERAVDQLDLDDELVALGQPELPLLHLVADALHLVLGDAEVDPHRRQHRDRRELAVLRIDVGAVGDRGEAADAVDRRGDRRVREVELRRLELRLRLRDRGRGLLVLALRVVEVLLRQRVLLRRAAWCARGSPSRPRSAAWLRCSAAAAPSTCAWNGFWSIRNSTWPALTTAPSVYTRLSRKPDTRAAMLTACELCVCATNVARDRHVARRDREHGDFGRRPRGGLLVVLAAAGEQGERCEQRGRRAPARRVHGQEVDPQGSSADTPDEMGRGKALPAAASGHGPGSRHLYRIAPILSTRRRAPLAPAATHRYTVERSD